MLCQQTVEISYYIYETKTHVVVRYTSIYNQDIIWTFTPCD